MSARTRASMGVSRIFVSSSHTTSSRNALSSKSNGGVPFAYPSASKRAATLGGSSTSRLARSRSSTPWMARSSSPSSTSERYIRTVAKRWRPLSKAIFSCTVASKASWWSLYCCPSAYRSTCSCSWCVTGTIAHSAARFSMRSTTSSNAMGTNAP